LFDFSQANITERTHKLCHILRWKQIHSSEIICRETLLTLHLCQKHSYTN